MYKNDFFFNSIQTSSNFYLNYYKFFFFQQNKLKKIKKKKIRFNRKKLKLRRNKIKRRQKKLLFLKRKKKKLFFLKKNLNLSYYKNYNFFRKKKFFFFKNNFQNFNKKFSKFFLLKFFKIKKNNFFFSNSKKPSIWSLMLNNNINSKKTIRKQKSKNKQNLFLKKKRYKIKYKLKRLKKFKNKMKYNYKFRLKFKNRNKRTNRYGKRWFVRSRSKLSTKTLISNKLFKLKHSFSKYTFSPKRYIRSNLKKWRLLRKYKNKRVFKIQKLKKKRYLRKSLNLYFKKYLKLLNSKRYKKFNKFIVHIKNDDIKDKKKIRAKLKLNKFKRINRKTKKKLARTQLFQINKLFKKVLSKSLPKKRLFKYLNRNLFKYLKKKHSVKKLFKKNYSNKKYFNKKYLSENLFNKDYNSKTFSRIKYFNKRVFNKTFRFKKFSKRKKLKFFFFRFLVRLKTYKKKFLTKKKKIFYFKKFFILKNSLNKNKEFFIKNSFFVKYVNKLNFIKKKNTFKIFKNILFFKNKQINFFIFDLKSKIRNLFVLNSNGFLYLNRFNSTRYFRKEKSWSIRKIIYSFAAKNDLQNFILKKYIKNKHFAIKDLKYSRNPLLVDLNPYDFKLKYINWGTNVKSKCREREFFSFNGSLFNSIFTPYYGLQFPNIYHSLYTFNYSSLGWTDNILEPFFLKTLNSKNFEFNIKKTRFKPGYSTMWRDFRTTLKTMLDLKFKYQKKLTKYLLKFNKIIKNRLYFLFEMQLENVVTLSKFFPDKSWSVFFINEGYVFVNNRRTYNIYEQLFKNDFIQLAVSLKYYIIYRWLMNWHIIKKNKLRRRLNSKINAKNLPDDKQKSRNLPIWLIKNKNLKDDVSRYLEVDYVSLSCFILYEPLFFTDINPLTFLSTRFSIINLFNWKYIN